MSPGGTLLYPSWQEMAMMYRTRSRTSCPECYDAANTGDKYVDADGKVEYEKDKGRPFELRVTDSCIA